MDPLKSVVMDSANLESVNNSPRVEEQAFPRVLVCPRQGVIRSYSLILVVRSEIRNVFRINNCLLGRNVMVNNAFLKGFNERWSHFNVIVITFLVLESGLAIMGV